MENEVSWVNILRYFRESCCDVCEINMNNKLSVCKVRKRVRKICEVSKSNEM
jgi:hypothetical protein